ncbi:hypothetical protein, partial [Kingella kingae]|uniref:hypothetical protein n=1 Tax=Kingella kingae TaxID=504 RepID=UPI00135628C9
FFHNFYFSTSWKLEFGKLNTAQVERLNAMLSLNHVNENNNVQAAFLHKQTVKKQPALCYRLFKPFLQRAHA